MKKIPFSSSGEKRMKKNGFILIVMAAVLMFSCNKIEKNEILVLHAGSLSVPFKHMALKFMKKFPQIKVVLEAHGSRTAARQISDLKRSVDVMASADSSVIRKLLMPEFADFCIDFSTNEMILMYTDSSKFSREINSTNWMEILFRDGVQYGHSNPDADPCGYRALLTWKLAERHYKIPGLFRELQSRMPKRNIRPKETDLIALLEVSELDYIFIYRSIACQHGMKYVILPDEINLKCSVLESVYEQVSVRVSGKEPGKWIEKKGAPMVYGVTLPKNSNNPLWAERFIAFSLGSEGQQIMEDNGQPGIIPLTVDHYDRLPTSLKKFFKNEI